MIAGVDLHHPHAAEQLQVERELGRHEEDHRQRGTSRRYSAWPHDLLDPFRRRHRSVALEAIAFLDTETTGLAGGSGTYAFLIGVGSIHRDGFRVRQFFMRDYEEEASVLHSLSAYLSQFRAMVTYNGRSYDQPLLETRYTMARSRHPFSKLEHLDLLYGARRLFKLRLENCRLTNLETEILGFDRGPDIPES